MVQGALKDHAAVTNHTPARVVAPPGANPTLPSSGLMMRLSRRADTGSHRSANRVRSPLVSSTATVMGSSC